MSLQNRPKILEPLSIILLAFALRLYKLAEQSIWWDEGHSILMASAPIAQIPTLPGMDVHPPGFFVSLHLWMSAAGQTEFALRFYSLAFSLLTVALLIRFGGEMAGKRAGLWAGLLLALSPFYVAYAQEVRMYAMLTFFATASVYFLWKIVQTADEGRRRDVQREQRSGESNLQFVHSASVSQKRGEVGRFSPSLGGIKGGHLLLGYTLATTAALYTHYFTLFLLCFEGLVWLWWVIKGRSIRRLVYWLATQALIILLFAPQLWLALQQITGYANPNLKPPGLWPYISHNWQAYTLGLTLNPAQFQPYLIALFLLLIIGLIVSYWLTRSPTYPLSLAFLLTWLLIPLALYFIVLQSRPSYEPRYMMLITPALYLLFGLAFSPRRWFSSLLGVAVVVIFLLGLQSYFSDTRFFKDDANAVANYLARETTPNDIVYVDVPHPFHYYAERIPAPTNYLFVDVHTAAETLNAEALGRDRLYWITWWGSDTDPRGVIDYLAQKQAGPAINQIDFRGYKLTEYALSERPFALPTELVPAEVNFDNLLLLDGLAYSETLAPGEAGWATLHFTQLAPTDIDYKISLRLQTPEGQLLAQVDKPILNDRHFQTSAWPIDDPALNQAINVYTLPLNDPTYSGPLILSAVVYNAETGDSIATYGVPTLNDDLVSAQIGMVQVGE